MEADQLKWLVGVSYDDQDRASRITELETMWDWK